MRLLSLYKSGPIAYAVTLLANATTVSVHFVSLIAVDSVNHVIAQRFSSFPFANALAFEMISRQSRQLINRSGKSTSQMHFWQQSIF